MRVEQELHVMLNKHCGHMSSTDCWCEPARVYLAVVQGLPGITKVIEHEDDRIEHHIVTLNRRECDRALVNQPNSIDAPWITRALTPPWSPPALPPHDPTQRNI